MSAPVPFEIRVPDADLADLQDRLMRTRWPDTNVDNDDWSYGANTNYLKQLAEFWQTCDWRAQENYLNGGFGCGAHHFTIKLPPGSGPGSDLTMHFVQAKASGGGGVPLLLLHGWPGSFFEFHSIFKPLVDAGFDVIAPSLPGYGFSEAPHERHFGPIHMAEAMDLLMRTLGYPWYVAQGGDWGSMITMSLAKLSSLGKRTACRAAHCNMVSAGPPPKEVMANLPPLSDWDKQGLARAAEYQQNDAGYSKIQGTKPQSIGTALNDSPAGLLGWIVEKLRTWSDCDGDPENCFSKMVRTTVSSAYKLALGALITMLITPILLSMIV